MNILLFVCLIVGTNTWLIRKSYLRLVKDLPPQNGSEPMFQAVYTQCTPFKPERIINVVYNATSSLILNVSHVS